MGNLLTRITKFRQRMKNMFDVFEGRTPWVLMLGLDGAGKTSLLYKSKLDDTICAVTPPRGINIEQMTPVRGATIQLYDIPGSKMTRHLWSHWYKNTEAIVFVVDSGDKVRVDEAMFELNQVLEAPGLRNVPIIVVANKQDVQDAMSLEHVQLELGLDAITNRSWSIVGTSAEKGQGINKAFKEVVEKIKEYRCMKKGLKMKKSVLESKEAIKAKEAGFTSIEDVEAMTRGEKVPSLFGAIKEKDKKEQTTDLDNLDDSVEGIGVDSVEYDKIDKDVPSNKSSLSEVEIVHSSTSSAGSDGPAPDEVEVVDVDSKERPDVNTETEDSPFKTVANEVESVDVDSVEKPYVNTETEGLTLKAMTEKDVTESSYTIEENDRSVTEEVTVQKDKNGVENSGDGRNDKDIRQNLESDDDVSTEEGNNDDIIRKVDVCEDVTDKDDTEDTQVKHVSDDYISVEDLSDGDSVVNNKDEVVLTKSGVHHDVVEANYNHDSYDQVRVQELVDDEVEIKQDEHIKADIVKRDIDVTKDNHVGNDDLSSLSSDNSSLSADEV